MNNEMDIKSRKYQVGYAKTVKSLRIGKAKAVIIARNIPPLQKSSIEYWARLFQTPIYHYRGSDWQLGMACGKHSRVCALSITDLSNANIIHLSGEYFIVIKRYTMVGKWKLTQSSYVGQAMTNSFVNSYLNYHLNFQIYTNKTFLVAFHKNSF